MFDIQPLPSPMPDRFHGWYRMANEVYHNKAPGISPSGLRAMDKSPAHFQAMDQWEETEPMKFGFAFHAYVLEPELYTNLYEIHPDKTKFTDSLKENAELRGVIPIKQKDHDRIQAMGKAVLSHPYSRMFFKREGIAEASGFWTDPAREVQCKLRPDWIVPDIEVIVDLKKVGTYMMGNQIPSSPEAFARKIANLDYHWSAWWQLEGLNLIEGVAWQHFLWVAVEDTPPYTVGVYRATEEMLKQAERKCRVALARYADCLATGEWPGPGYSLQDIYLPQWKVKKDMEEPIFE